MSAIDTITSTITNAPLYQMIENMGIAVANAQTALDENSIRTLQALSEKGVTVNGETTNLLLLGFVPTFYAFTEASFEMKMEFSMAESEAFSLGVDISANGNKSNNGNDKSTEKKTSGMIAASVNASYARKFDQSASASSSISARMVSLPPPENLIEMLKSIKPKTN